MGTDAGEAIEIAGLPGTDLTGWDVVHTGNGAVYDTDLSPVQFSSSKMKSTVAITYPSNGMVPRWNVLVDANNDRLGALKL